MADVTRVAMCLLLALAGPWASAQEDTAPPETMPRVTWETPAPEQTVTAPPETLDAPETAPAAVETGEEAEFARRMEDLYRENPAPEAGDAGQTGRVEPPDLGELLLRVVGSLCVMVGLIVLGGVVLRRYGGRRPLLLGQAYGRVVGRVSLGQRTALVYVRTGGRVLVVGVSQQSVNPVAEFDEEAFADLLGDDPEAAETGAARPDFLSALRKAAEKEGETPSAAAEDDEMTQLRNDLHRLRHYLRESGRDRDA